MVSMRELSEQILGQTILNKETKDYVMTPRGPVRRPEEAVQVEESIFTKPLDMEGRFSILPLRDMPDGTREYALPLPMAEMMNAFTAPGRSFMQPDFDAEKEALDTALAFTGGSSVGTAPVGSLAMGAPRRPKGIQATAKMPKMSKDQLIQAGYYHPIGENKLRTLVGDVDFETTPSGILVPKRTLKPEDLEGGRIVFDAGDRAVAGQKLVRVNGIELDDPIDLRGGPDFMRYGKGSVWASDGSAVTAINKQARGSEGDAYFLPTLMSPISVNFNTMMADALIQQVSKMKISKKNKKLFDKKLKAIRPEWEGLDSENAKNQLKANGALRKPFVELMDKAEFQNLGFPDVASTRVAITDPEYLDLPLASGGMTVGRISKDQPILENVIIPHPTYNTQIGGEYIGGFEVPIPRQLLAPDFYAQRRALGTDPKDDPRSFQLLKPSQEATPEWVDRLSEYIENAKQLRD
jgi:hypothetical protein